MSGYATVVRYSVLRLVRNTQALIFLAMPLFIIPVLAAAFSWIPAGTAYLKGAANTLSFFAIGMTVLFQLFGGSYGMTNVRALFLTPFRWRVHALPCRPMVIVSGVLTATTLVSLGQGVLLLAFAWILGATLGNPGVVLVVLTAIALLSQLLGVTILLLVRNTTTAFVLAWMVAYGSGVLGGIIFPLPTEVPFFRFTVTYGTPFSLAQTALLDASKGGPADEIALCIGALFLVCALFAGLTAALGRRKLA